MRQKRLSCVAVCCSVLQRVAVCWSVLQCVAACYNVLQCITVCCSVLQYAAVCCSVLRPTDLEKTSLIVASQINTLKKRVSYSRRRQKRLSCVAVCCSVLQCVAVYYSVLQYVAVCCSVLRLTDRTKTSLTVALQINTLKNRIIILALATKEAV